MTNNVSCRQCSALFTITGDDVQFYQQLEIPHPTFCPDCRLQRRLAWRNERFLYHRRCAATNKDIISVFSPEKKVIVYDNDYWFSDSWNAMDYGVAFDFGRPFFDQFRELMFRVPQMARSADNNENSDYVNQAGNCRNCYLVFEAVGNEDCLYSNNLYSCRSCVDMLQVDNCELCYECINCDGCYELSYSEDCQSCSSSSFLKSCIGCANCFGSVNLRNKQYYFFNEPLSAEEYAAKVSSLPRHTLQQIETLRAQFQTLAAQFPTKFIHGTQNEGSSGDYLWNTERCSNCFDLRSSQDCKHVSFCANMKSSYDVTVFGGLTGAEFCYESHCIGESISRIFFCDQVWSGGNELYYSKACGEGSVNLFGCVGLRKGVNSIFNRSFSTHEFERLSNRIKAHMMETGEWGEFFPMRLSPFAYNETEAQFYFPLTREDAEARKFAWRDPDNREFPPQSYAVPERIDDVPDEIVNQRLTCTECAKNFKITRQELSFYRTGGFPIPQNCQECRHRRRLMRKNPMRLQKRSCIKCAAEVETTYSTQRPEPIYCEACYLSAVE